MRKAKYDVQIEDKTGLTTLIRTTSKAEAIKAAETYTLHESDFAIYVFNLLTETSIYSRIK